MIDPKELRIGNWVICPKGLATIKVIDSRTCDILTCPPKGSDWCGRTSDLQPIPLIAAVLESCGFERCEERFRLMISDKYGDIYLAPLKDGEFGIGENNRYRHRLEFLTYTIPCSALHQLQNLYYALTGKELEIDETKLEAAIAKADIV